MSRVAIDADFWGEEDYRFNLDEGTLKTMGKPINGKMDDDEPLEDYDRPIEPTHKELVRRRRLKDGRDDDVRNVKMNSFRRNKRRRILRAKLKVRRWTKAFLASLAGQDTSVPLSHYSR